MFCEGRVSQTLCFVGVNFRDPLFSISFWGVDVTDAYYLHQKRASVDLGLTWSIAPQVTREAARNPQCKHCLGNLKMWNFFMEVCESILTFENVELFYGI